MNNSFPLLWQTIRERILSRIGDVSFLSYLLLGVIIFGATGLWVEMFKVYVGATPAVDAARSNLAAICTYFPAVAGAAACQIIIGEDERRFLRSSALVVVSLLIIVAGLLLSGRVFPTQFAYALAVMATVVSVLLWWIANATEQGIADSTASIGGRPTTVPPGDTSGFNTAG